MSSSRSRQILATKEEAIVVVRRVLNGDDTRFDLVPFETYNKNAKLRSEHYNGFFIVCYANSLRSAGWLVCRYAKNGRCPVEKALQCFKTVQGGTSRLKRHTLAHKNNSGILRSQRQLPGSAKSKIAEAAAYAVSLDNRPLTFCDGHAGMRIFAKSIFEMGQTIPANEEIDAKSYLPRKVAVTKAIQEISDTLRQKFASRTKNGMLHFGGAVTVDGVT